MPTHISGSYLQLLAFKRMTNVKHKAYEQLPRIVLLKLSCAVSCYIIDYKRARAYRVCDGQ